MGLHVTKGSNEARAMGAIAFREEAAPEFHMIDRRSKGDAGIVAKGKESHRKGASKSTP